MIAEEAGELCWERFELFLSCCTFCWLFTFPLKLELIHHRLYHPWAGVKRFDSFWVANWAYVTFNNDHQLFTDMVGNVYKLNLIGHSINFFRVFHCHDPSVGMSTEIIHFSGFIKIVCTKRKKISPYKRIIPYMNKAHLLLPVSPAAWCGSISTRTEWTGSQCRNTILFHTRYLAQFKIPPLWYLSHLLSNESPNYRPLLLHTVSSQ